MIGWQAAPWLRHLWFVATTPAEAQAGHELSVFHAGCDAARAAGAAPLHRGTPGYRDTLDRDGDGVACEPLPRGR